MLFSDINEATAVLEQNINKLKKMCNFISNNDNEKIELFGESIIRKAIISCEAILYLCCYEDSDENDDNTFPMIKDLVNYFGNMNISKEIREIALNISKVEGYDNEFSLDEINTFSLFENIENFLNWIIDNARNDSIKNYSKQVLEIISPLITSSLGE